MSIAIFDKFVNAIPAMVFDGKDVDKVLLVDPPSGLPSLFLANKGALNTQTKVITYYDASGNHAGTLDLTGTDITGLEQEIASISSDVTKNTSDIATVTTIAKSNANDISTMQFNIGTNSNTISSVSDVADLALSKAESNETSISSIQDEVDSAIASFNGLDARVDNHDTLISNNKTTADAADELSKANKVDISTLSGTVGNNTSQIGVNTKSISDLDTKVSGVESTATAADSLSKANKVRLDDLPSTPDLSGYAKLGTSVNFTDVTATGLDFTGKGSTAKVTNDHNIDVAVSGNINVAFKSSGMELLAPVDVNGQTQNNLGDIYFNNGKNIFGSGVGTLEIRNIGAIRRNSTTDANSVTLGSGVNIYQSDSHTFKNNSGTSLLSVGTNIDVNNRKVQNVSDAVGDKDAPNFAQVKSLIIIEEWFEVARGDLASNGSRPTGGSSDNKVNVWHETVEASTTNPNNELKIAYNGAYNKVSKWSHALRYKLVQGDKVQYWGVGSNGWGSGANVWHLSADKVEGDDLVLGVDTIIYASAYFVGADGNSPQEMDGFKKYIQAVSSGTFYEHQGDSHLYIEYTGNGGTISLDTMRSETDQHDDITTLHNTTDTECSLRLYFDGSSVTHNVPAKSYIQGWANRDIGRWVTVITKEANQTPEQLVIKSTNLSWTTSSDPRVNTSRMIQAAPPVCIIIGRHIANGSAKEKIVSVGDSNKNESQTSTFVVHKHSNGHATGMCTSEESSGKTWSRILDGKRGAWFTNESSNSRMASSEIDPIEYPENQLFFTTDLGIMETYLDEVTGEISLRALEGYNVPKNEIDISNLKDQNELGKTKQYDFINADTLTVPYNNPEMKSLVEVNVLNTFEEIPDSIIDVVDSLSTLTGTYTSVGSYAIDSDGNWTSAAYHNAYKHSSQSYYVVFSQIDYSWKLIIAANDHISIGSVAASSTNDLCPRSQLPETGGQFTIINNFSSIKSEYFIPAQANIQYNEVDKEITVDFGGSKPCGYILVK
jgi:hypothetical protein